MFHTRLYYAFKPYVPWTIRMVVRRWFAARIRRRAAGVWPIMPGSERLPQDWHGWPDGKGFAFVLTHDVEGPEGLAKVKPLAELEMSLGFRSSFNFIPKGPYTVTAELRAWLTQNGFEVGVHDLNHDGKLFTSREVFARKALWINQSLRDWGAVGYRSGFMFHNLDWQQDLEIAYDGSTFDTDPFEPQPDGVGTIFPFWVPRPASALTPNLNPSHNLNPVSSPNPTSIRPLPSDNPTTSNFELRTSNFNSTGYVELPYTLPQDSTLFLVLREKSPEIWLRKLDWIAENGGMALVNVHPDYLRFPGEPSRPDTYPVEFYRQLLDHVRSRYQAEVWSALPREVAKRVVMHVKLSANGRNPSLKPGGAEDLSARPAA